MARHDRSRCYRVDIFVEGARAPVAQHFRLTREEAQCLAEQKQDEIRRGGSTHRVYVVHQNDLIPPCVHRKGGKP